MKNLKMKSARVAKDLSQQQLADLIGVSRQTISAIEKGDYNPTPLWQRPDGGACFCHPLLLWGPQDRRPRSLPPCPGPKATEAGRGSSLPSPKPRSGLSETSPWTSSPSDIELSSP